MKKSIPILIIVLLVIACGESQKKSAQEQKENIENPKKMIQNASLPSGDYSALLLNYECDMTAAELAQIFNIPEADVNIPEFAALAGRCSFEIKGFGENAQGGTIMSWGATPSSKAESKKEIQSFLKDQENNESMFGMGIDLAETGDCYIARMPHVGRVIIYNENYDHAFLFSYAQRGIYKRTEEEHEVLTKKTIALANYLLKKHRK